jgi:hypothetical protein
VQAGRGEAHPHHVLHGRLHGEMADGAEVPAVVHGTTPTPTARALSMASRIAFGPTMMPRRFSASITAVAGASRSIRQPGWGLSLPAL